jgi:hypothetical protein
MKEMNNWKNNVLEDFSLIASIQFIEVLSILENNIHQLIQIVHER